LFKHFIMYRNLYGNRRMPNGTYGGVGGRAG
jgi:hypothetical protein